MSENPIETPRVELEIYGITFRLRAPGEDHDRIRRAARHVDNQMRELVVSHATPDTARLAIQAALLIAMDFYKLMEDEASLHGARNENQQRVDDLLQRLDDSLRAL